MKKPANAGPKAIHKPNTAAAGVGRKPVITCISIYDFFENTLILFLYPSYLSLILIKKLSTKEGKVAMVRTILRVFSPFFSVAGWSSPVARQAHNLKVAGSNPAPATKET